MAMATLSTSATCSSLASSASPSMGIGGRALLTTTCPITSRRLPTSVRPSVVRASSSSSGSGSGEKSSLERSSSSNNNNRRRAFLFGAALFVATTTSLLSTSGGSDSALADAPIDGKKKKNKCPTICVQTPTASCCFGYGK